MYTISDLVEHEVMPTFTDRFAITLWASAVLPSSASSPRPSNFSIIYKELDHSWQIPLKISHLNVNEELQHISTQKSIYVSMANYRDTEGPKTILDLYLKASFPFRVYVGHIFQGTDEEIRTCTTSETFLESLESCEELSSELVAKFISWCKSNVKTVNIDLKDATGPCYARYRAMVENVFDDQDYVMQIDSHMRCRPGYDSYLIALLEKIKQDESFSKPIVSTYPLGYHLPNTVPKSTLPTLLVRFSIFFFAILFLLFGGWY